MDKRILVDLIDPIKEARFGVKQVKQVERKKEHPISGYRIPSQHAEKYISKLQAFRGFKVLGLKSEGNTKVAIDLFTGSVINLGGKGVESRITQSVQLYDSKSRRAFIHAYSAIHAENASRYFFVRRACPAC